ncbi:MAG: hypothetical protein R6V54_11620 [Desulfobacteraceae bacterium]
MNHKTVIDTLLKTIETLPDEKVVSITRGAHIVGVESKRTHAHTREHYFLDKTLPSCLYFSHPHGLPATLDHPHTKQGKERAAPGDHRTSRFGRSYAQSRSVNLLWCRPSWPLSKSKSFNKGEKPWV